MKSCRMIDRHNSFRLYIRITDSQKQKYLVGRDEGRLFRTPVSMRCTTIQGALDWLRPVPHRMLKRQGDLFFVPVALREGLPSYMHRAGNYYRLPGRGQYNPWHSTYNEAMANGISRDDESNGYSSHTYTYRAMTEIGNTRHVAEFGLTLWKSGEVAFLGRRKIRTHSYTAKPRFFVSGFVSHPQHETLELEGWWEVLPQNGMTIESPAD